jgi:hypothetical protein
MTRLPDRKWLVLALAVSLLAVPACDDDDDITDLATTFDEETMNQVLEDLIAPLLDLDIPLPGAAPVLGIVPECFDVSEACTGGGSAEICPEDETRGSILVVDCVVDGLTLNGDPFYNVGECLNVDLNALHGETDDFECVYTNVLTICETEYASGQMLLTLEPGGVQVFVAFDGTSTATSEITADEEEIGTCVLDLVELTSVCEF